MLKRRNGVVTYVNCWSPSYSIEGIEFDQKISLAQVVLRMRNHLFIRAHTKDTDFEIFKQGCNWIDFRIGPFTCVAYKARYGMTLEEKEALLNKYRACTEDLTLG